MAQDMNPPSNAESQPVAPVASSHPAKLRVGATILGVIVIEAFVLTLLIGRWQTTGNPRPENAPVAIDAAPTAAPPVEQAKTSANEVDLGKFAVTSYQPASNTTLFISFHLFGTVTPDNANELARRLDDNKHRIRDNVIVIVRGAEVADLTDAGLGLIKRRILETSNATLGKPLLQAVVFSDFSLIEH